MMDNGTDEIITVTRGWARAPWETNTPSVPVGANTRMMIASMSKLVTNIALRAMIDDWNWILSHPPFRPHTLPGGFPIPGLPPVFLPPGIKPTMVLRALQSGKPLSLDTHVLDLIGHRIPTPGPGTDAITLRMLLNHASGIDVDQVDWQDGGNTDTVDLWGGIARTFALGVDPNHIHDQPPFPGYHNHHYVILRGVIEDVTGIDYEGYGRIRV